MTNDNFSGANPANIGHTVHTLRILSILSFIRQHKQRFVALTFWLLLIGSYIWFVGQNNLSLASALHLIVDFSASSIYAPIIYIVIYTIRPIVFGSTVIMTSSAGFLFGPLWGTVYAILGGNFSASLAYLIGRYFGGDMVGAISDSPFVAKYTNQLRENGFEAVLFMRLLLLPYDAISYLCGFLIVPWFSFTLATLIGGIPGTIAFVLFGSSIENTVSTDASGLNPWVIIASVTLFLLSVGLSWYLKRRQS